MTEETKNLASFFMEKGLGWAFFAFVVYVVLKSLPVLRDEIIAARLARASERASILALMEVQRVEHAHSWEQQRQFYQAIFQQQVEAAVDSAKKVSEAIEETARSVNRLFAVVLAHDRKTGGSTKELLRQANEMTGEAFTPSPDWIRAQTETKI